MGTRVMYGINAQLEEHATALILASLEGVTSREEKSDIMTPWKQKHRHDHEILTRTGMPVDPAVRRGQFTKAWNPDKPQLNSRDCPTRPMKMSATWDDERVDYGSGPLSSAMAEVFGVERVDN